ncbi:hypothetical protein SAMN04489809_0508 [Microbacterium paraoxydans]|uniref:Uncharacterized protein n=1 Tax=Microbacterium paraoxydans TaxID=199592 RepID=A0A1H1MG22_9MICO|nr:hypothetical protein SAMN04489809_0508 [Microbacterium paraoxydans]
MRAAVRHDAIADTVPRLAPTVWQFEDELDGADGRDYEGKYAIVQKNKPCVVKERIEVRYVP